MALKILIIDDDSSSTMFVSLLLRTNGMNVIVAYAGETGIQKVREETPDLVLLDMMDTKREGLEICQSIRSFSDVPILIHSNVDGLENITQAKAAGANDYLIKFAPNQILVGLIKKLVDSNR